MHGYVGRGYEGEKVTSVQGRLFTVTLPRTIRIQVVASVACCNADASCGQVAIAALSSASMGYSIRQILSRCLSLANMRTMFPVIDVELSSEFVHRKQPAIQPLVRQNRANIQIALLSLKL